MKWAALDNVEIPNDKERTIKTKGGDIYEKLIERDEAKMYYSWSYNFPAAFGDFGTNIWGSLQVTTDKEGGSRSKTFVSYSMNSDVISQAEVDRLNPLMKHEVEDVGAKLVKYIEANI